MPVRVWLKSSKDYISLGTEFVHSQQAANKSEARGRRSRSFPMTHSSRFAHVRMRIRRSSYSEKTFMRSQRGPTKCQERARVQAASRLENQLQSTCHWCISLSCLELTPAFRNSSAVAAAATRGAPEPQRGAFQLRSRYSKVTTLLHFVQQSCSTALQPKSWQSRR